LVHTGYNQNFNSTNTYCVTEKGAGVI